MRLRRLLRVRCVDWRWLLQLYLALVSGVVICRPGGSYPGSLPVSSCDIKSANPLKRSHAASLKTQKLIMRNVLSNRRFVCHH